MISIFDTSIANYNTGNQIIMDAVNKHIDPLFPNDIIIRLPVEDMDTITRKYNTQSRWSFVGGTNLLNGNIRKYKQWGLDLHNIMMLKRCVLVGCGWFQYEDFAPTKYTSWALKKILDPTIIHSVRDQYTHDKLAQIGIQSINTGCPTLWQIDPNLPEINNKPKSSDCVVAFTDYAPNPKRDLEIFRILQNNYRNIYLFIQGSGDVKYLQSIGIYDTLTPLPARVEAFNDILKRGADYIGTRLHAGIRALQLNQRSFIIGIDNRAIEMSRDFNLPVFREDQLSTLENAISRNYDVHLNLPLENIERWKSQFKK